MKLCECECGYGLCASIPEAGWILKKEYVSVRLPGVGTLLVAENKVNDLGVNTGKQLYHREVNGGTIRFTAQVSSDTELLFRFRSALLDVQLDFTTCVSKGHTVDLVDRLRLAKNAS